VIAAFDKLPSEMVSVADAAGRVLAQPPEAAAVLAAGPVEAEPTLGQPGLVVGLGAIGSRVAALAKAFGMYVLGIRRSPEMLAHVDAQGTLADLSGFLSVADFVVLSLPFTEEQRGLIDRSALALLKPTAVLINVARGAIVDVVALTEALQAKQLRSACLDVLPTEPWPAADNLWDTPRLFITPHNAWSSPLYLPRVASVWIENLRRYVRGDELLHVIPPLRASQ
jgi:phosphoglycerate dehydrogenase-like enzyme